MIIYNICFIRQGERVLLLNRERPSWMGCWNGIGGKLDSSETARESMIREIQEETGIAEYELFYKGLVTWTSDGANYGGMYLYSAVVGDVLEYGAPVKTSEGILDWKSIDWILHPKNQGVASNIPYFLESALWDERCYDHYCDFRGGKLVEVTREEIAADTETLDGLERYLADVKTK